jgi:hypothetical protein
VYGRPGQPGGLFLPKHIQPVMCHFLGQNSSSQMPSLAPEIYRLYFMENGIKALGKKKNV